MTLSLDDWVRLWWGILWRGSVYVVLSLVLGFFLASELGALIAVGVPKLGGTPEEGVQLARKVGIIPAFVMLVVGLPFLIRWLLVARYGHLRLQVVSERQVV